MSVTQYYVSSHIFLCPTEYHWVILDSQDDKYICVPRKEFDQVGPWLHGWQQLGTRNRKESEEISAEARQLASQLVEQHILCESSIGGKPIVLADIPAPRTTLNSVQSSASKALTFMRSPSFFAASRTANRLLTQQPLPKILQVVRDRKRTRRAATPSFDIKKATQLVLSFNALRWFYPRDYLCLFDSLALLEFLALRNVYPSWVFGVMTDPFQAHCWVQEGDIVLNDTVEHVSQFTRIMCI